MATKRYIYATSAGVYSTDGTSAGTTLLVAAGTDFVPQTNAQMVTLPNGKVLFFALVNGLADPTNGSVEGIQVWETDGTVSGTSMTGSTYSLDGDQTAGDSIGNVVAIGSEVSFVSNVPGLSPVLFVTNGTSAGTLPESETLPQTGLPSTGALTGGSSAPKYIYATSAGVYSTDGTSTGTTLLVAAGTDFVPQTGAQMVTLPNGKVLFFALVNGYADPVNGELEGIQVWETDGTVSRTSMTGYTYSLDGDQTAGDSISNVVAIGSEVSFVSNIPGNSPSLFVTDGTSAGTLPETTPLPQTGLVNGADTLCFLPGTKIATPDGEIPVQHLAPGMLVRTASGSAREIRWVGRGKVLATRGRRSAATPVIVRKGALADNVPNADLRITKAHGFYIDGVLIPAEYLVNHRSILWDDHAREVSLYHIELDSHDILIANGAPAESYRDDGNRWLFQNANDGWHLPPCPPCVPVLTGGPVVDAAWRRFLDRAGPRKLPPMTDDPDLHLVVDGLRIDPVVVDGMDSIFVMSSTARSVRLVSREVIPAEQGLARDPRALGVAVRQIAMERGSGRIAIGARDPALALGFHDYEADVDLRWTNGDAMLPAALFTVSGVASFKLTVTLAMTTRYPDWGDGGLAAVG